MKPIKEKAKNNITHTVQLEPYKDNNDCRKSGEHSTNTSERIPNKDLSIMHPENQDFDNIEVISVENNYTLNTPIKTNLKRVNLDDILKYHKTPERKGVKNIKKTSFVITSTDVKKEQLKKMKEKEEKEECIRKRKEDREQKKLLLEKTKQIKKEQKADYKKNKDIKKKPDAIKEVKKILFSEDFTNLNLDMSLKTQQSDHNLESIEKEKNENEENCKDIEQSKEKYMSKYDKAIKTELTKLNKRLKENINKPMPKIQTRKKDTKKYVNKLPCSQDFKNLDEDEEPTPVSSGRPAQKLSLSDIEKILSD